MIAIEGEKVIRYHIHGEQQGDLCFDKLTTLKDTYNKLKETKKFDKEHFIEDIYWIECETETSIYGDYTIRKYRNRYMLVPIK